MIGSRTSSGLGEAPRLELDRAAARARFLAIATRDVGIADAVKSHPAFTMIAAIAAGFLVARRGTGLPLVVALARLWLNIARKSS